jgi:hypothetical protein
MSIFVRRAVIALTGGAAALAGAAMPALASSAPTGWRTAALISTRGNETALTSVAAASPADAWAAGVSAPATASTPDGFIERWAGESWKAVVLPSAVEKAWDKSGLSLTLVGASSSTNVWVFNEFPAGSAPDTYVRLAGRKWATGTIPGTTVSTGHFVVITSVEVFAKAGVWVFGGEVKLSAGQAALAPYAAHYNGRRWSTVAVPGSGEITAVSAISPGNMWAVVGVNSLGSAISTTSKPAVLHWNGSRWQRASSQPSLPADADLTAVAAGAGNQVWVAGDVPTKAGGTVADFVAANNGRDWAAPVTLPRSAATATASAKQPYEIESLVQDGRGGLWALAGNLAPARPRVWHYAPGKWSLPASPSFGTAQRFLLQLAAVPGSPGSVWAAGSTGKQASAEGLIAITGPTPR